MTGFSLDDSSATDTIWRDVIFLALAGFVALVLLMLPHLNPRGAKAQATADPGNVLVEVRWPDEIDADVDLWVQAPGDVPVGYSNKGGLIFNLLRDDLGSRADASDLNYEASYSRGIPAGEYTVNLHAYRNSAGQWPIEVRVVTSVKLESSKSAQQILASTATLVREGQEITVYRFTLNEKGALVPGSVNALQRKIRGIGKP